jgi:hypothetical protein
LIQPATAEPPKPTTPSLQPYTVPVDQQAAAEPAKPRMAAPPPLHAEGPLARFLPQWRIRH